MDAEPGTKKISVIIPTLNEEHCLPQTLDQFEHLHGTWEVLVVDSGSVDRTLDIARASGSIVVADAPAGRGAAMNAGVERASGELLLFLHADTLLPANAHALIAAALSRPDIAATAFRLRVDRDEWRYRILSPIATARFRVQRTFFGDQAVALRRQDFDRIGGYREMMLMEDVDLSKRLRRLGRLELLLASVTTSARRFERSGVLATLVRMSLLQAAYGLGVPADRLSRWYRHVRPAQRDTLPDRERIDLRQLELHDASGIPIDLDATLRQGPLLLVFLRWLG